MSELIQYKCPCCGGAVEFNSTAQKMKCPYCDTEISVDEYESLIAKADQVVAADAASDGETEQKKSVGRRRDLKDEGLPLRILWW